MFSWPELGTRVTLRYRRPPGSVPALSDAVGHLLAVDPHISVRTKTGAVVDVAPADVVAVRALTDRPVRTSEIRNLECAAAAATPAGQQHWQDGWLLRAGGGAALNTNSAVPLDLSASLTAVPVIVDWYAQRGLPARLAIPDRLLRPAPLQDAEYTEQVLVCTLPNVTTRGHRNQTLVRAALGDSPDGTRWVGLPAVDPADPERTALYQGLLEWGATRGATRGYLRLPDNGTPPPQSLGFRLHHRCRYVVLPTR